MLSKLLAIVVVAALVQARPPREELAPERPPPQYIPSEHELEQNRNAKYEFSSNVEDHISDLTQKRDEVRDGLNVKGSYEYSDGYHLRTVFYEADDKGYRVVKTVVKDLDGPKIDLTGTASVSNAAHGRHVQYRVQSIPVEGPVAKVISEM